MTNTNHIYAIPKFQVQDRPQWSRVGMPPPPLSTKMQDLLSKFAAKQKLKAVAREELAGAISGGMSLEGKEAGTFELLMPNPEKLAKSPAIRVLPPIPFPGGLKFPHFHLGDDIFRLDQKQWAAFSSMMVSEIKELLDGAGTLSFDQLSSMVEAAERLG